VKGFGQIIFATLLATLYHPIASLGWILYSVLQLSIRGLTDRLTYHLIIKPYGKIPSSNSWLARRVKGPGVGSSYFVIEPEMATLILQIHLERQEMRVYLDKIMHDIAEPMHKMISANAELLSTFGYRPNLHNVNFEKVKRRSYEIEEEIEKQLILRKTNRKIRGSISKLANIKQTPDDLARTLRKAHYIISRWYPAHVFKYMTDQDIAQFWESKSLSPGDWWGLTEEILIILFSKQFLSPVELDDETFCIRIDHPLSLQVMKKTYKHLWKKEEAEMKNEREPFEYPPPCKYAPITVSEFYHPTNHIQKTIAPWAFGVNTLKGKNLLVEDPESE